LTFPASIVVEYDVSVLVYEGRPMVAVGPKPEQVRWRASSLSAGSDCVEIAELGDMVGVRDSKNPDGPVIRLTRSTWRTFVDAIKRGDLD
jgi:hypothetical protein